MSLKLKNVWPKQTCLSMYVKKQKLSSVNLKRCNLHLAKQQLYVTIWKLF
ncbi:Uncharacterised protein [Mycobacteroides abscessus subsp. abscessus]|nr:Uncharacterised protein [Mycobacteroides abscessus subsp. abscessus]